MRRPSTNDDAPKRIYRVVSRIPPGRVASYGQVAELAGLPGRARQVGHALGSLPAGSAVPWHRVVNAAGRVSARGVPGADGFQRHLLEEEGVTFNPSGRIELAVFGWRLRRGHRR
jgi:methylated-DNA-protein-cysteine methyltransferase related protein